MTVMERLQSNGIPSRLRGYFCWIRRDGFYTAGLLTTFGLLRIRSISPISSRRFKRSWREKPIERPEVASFGCAIQSVYYLLAKALS